MFITGQPFRMSDRATDQVALAGVEPADVGDSLIRLWIQRHTSQCKIIFASSTCLKSPSYVGVSK